MAPNLVSSSPKGWSRTPDGTSFGTMMISWVLGGKCSEKQALTADILQGFLVPTAILICFIFVMNCISRGFIYTGVLVVYHC